MPQTPLRRILKEDQSLERGTSNGWSLFFVDSISKRLDHRRLHDCKHPSISAHPVHQLPSKAKDPWASPNCKREFLTKAKFRQSFNDHGRIRKEPVDAVPESVWTSVMWSIPTITCIFSYFFPLESVRTGALPFSPNSEARLCRRGRLTSNFWM